MLAFRASERLRGLVGHTCIRFTPHHLASPLVCNGFAINQALLIVPPHQYYATLHNFVSKKTKEEKRTQAARAQGNTKQGLLEKERNTENSARKRKKKEDKIKQKRYQEYIMHQKKQASKVKLHPAAKMKRILSSIDESVSDSGLLQNLELMSYLIDNDLAARLSMLVSNDVKLFTDPDLAMEAIRQFPNKYEIEQGDAEDGDYYSYLVKVKKKKKPLTPERLADLQEKSRRELEGFEEDCLLGARYLEKKEEDGLLGVKQNTDEEEEDVKKKGEVRVFATSNVVY